MPPKLPFEFEVVTLNAYGDPVIRRRGKASSFKVDLGNAVLLEMVAIPAGRFVMGSPPKEFDRGEEEGPQHSVAIAPFYLSRYPITQTQWQAIAQLPPVNRELEPQPARFRGDALPVEQVSWWEAVEFCDRLSRFTAPSSDPTLPAYRLPSEAEWEYACRAGTPTAFHFGATLSPSFSNYDSQFAYAYGQQGDFRNQTTPVDYFGVANPFGLSDLHGNVWEWCADPWHDGFASAPAKGEVWAIGGDPSLRILRGGSWFDNPSVCRSASRLKANPAQGYDIAGFRVARGLD